MSVSDIKPNAPASGLPYKIAVLVYVYNDAGELLLLHRLKEPNKDLYSPIGGKLEQATGESPYACALREITEEIGVSLSLSDIRLLGLVSEKGYHNGWALSGASHWLMFCFEVTKRLNFPGRVMEEGRLEWVSLSAIDQLKIPATDRQVIWPLVQKHSKILNPTLTDHEGFFSVHIDCTQNGGFGVVREFPL